MQVFRVISAAILVVALGGLQIAAQPLTQADGPKELPPDGYMGNQYVDSAGCVFIRAGVGGQTTWVPRVNRERKLVCGYDPTFAPVVSGNIASVTGGAEAAPATPETEAPKTFAPSTRPLGKPTVMAPSPTFVSATAPATGSARARSAMGGVVKIVRDGPLAKAATYCRTQAGFARRYLLSDGRRVTRCAAAEVAAPVAYINGLDVPGLRVVEAKPSPAEVRRATRLDAGSYRVIWSSVSVSAAEESTSEASNRPQIHKAEKPAAAAGGYVQVGVFADPANAARAIQRLEALGMPVSSSVGRNGGRPVKAIMAGPFASASDQRAALGKLRQSGYRDAYLRG